MDRLLNIDRPEGFPLCAETLGVLNENSEMFAEWLKRIPLKNRQAVQFGDYLLVCQNLQRRLVKRGAMIAASINQCKLVFTTEAHSVHDSSDNEIENVWVSEVADIVDETSPTAQWTMLGLNDVFEMKLWYDFLPSFSASLTAATVTDGSFGVLPQIHGDGNVMRTNNERLQMKLAIATTIVATSNSTILFIPIPAECPDGTRQEVDIEMAASGVHYSARSYIEGGELRVYIGSWLKEFIGWQYTANNPSYVCDIIIRINREVIL